MDSDSFASLNSPSSFDPAKESIDAHFNLVVNRSFQSFIYKKKGELVTMSSNSIDDKCECEGKVGKGASSLLHEVRQDDPKVPRELRNLFAGGVAGMIAKSVVAPFDRIKILYQISSAEFQISRVPAVAWNIIQNEGVSALWKGNAATMIRVFPYSGIQFMIFDRCKTHLLREQELRFLRQREADPGTPKPKWGLSPMESLFSGMLAGAVSVCCTYPLDLTRAQLAVLRKKNDPSNKSFFQVITSNYTNRVGSPNSSKMTYYVHFASHLMSLSFTGVLWPFSGNNTDYCWYSTILWHCIRCQ